MITKLPGFSAGLLLAIFIISAPGVYSQAQGPDAHYKLVSGGDYVRSKNYYLLTLFGQLPETQKLLCGDAVLHSIAKSKEDSLAAALKSCGEDGYCYLDRLKFSTAEISQVADRLKALYRPGNALDKLVKEHLIPSGTYILYQNLPAADFLVRAWQQDAEGVNYAIGVYGEGKRPNYPNIDSISYTTRDPRNSQQFDRDYLGLLYNVTTIVLKENQSSSVFFDIPLSAALRFIEVNGRQQAADYEPMTAGENKEAFERIKTIKWNDYKYSAILVPGAGPEDPGEALSGEGMIRCRLAAIQYKKGLAPFIIPSGGKAHPYKTPFCEAIEMKKYLIEVLHIPASAIIIEPHARHTTTNIRNAARIMYRYGIPFDKTALICTTRFQSDMIEKTTIARCLDEIHESPYRNGNRLSETELEFYPLLEALQINPEEPLDP